MKRGDLKGDMNEDAGESAHWDPGRPLEQVWLLL